MGYRLVVLDIDGTIRGNDHEITARTRDVISRVAAAGAFVTVATGRTFRSALACTEGLQITSPIISFQGARIADPNTGETVWHRPLTEDMALDALNALEGWDREILLYDGDHVYANKLTPWVEAYGVRNRESVRVASDLKSLAAKEPTRLVVVGDEDNILRLYRRLKADFDSSLLVTRSLPHFCEILHPGGGKHNALAWLSRHLGVARSETVAFGNSYDDVPMLAWAGLGVAVSGAPPDLLAVADRVAPPMEEDGAASVLENLLGRGLIG